MNIKQQFVKDYANILYNSQGAWCNKELSFDVCKLMAIEESRKMTKQEMANFLEDKHE